QELLAPGGVELHVRDALGALAGHLLDTALTEVVVVDAIARGELHVAVVTPLACHGVGEAVHRGRLRLERRLPARVRLDTEAFVARAPATAATAGRTAAEPAALTERAATVDVAGRLPPIDELGRDLLQEPARHGHRHLTELGPGHRQRQVQALARPGDAD